MAEEHETKQQAGGAVLLDRQDAIATLTLSNPGALNALTWTMYEQLAQHLASLAADETVRVVIVRGDGDKAFAAGTDIQQFQGFTGDDGVAYEQKMEEIVQGLYTLPKPTIAVVRGYAVGAGLALAAACDLRYATSEARFGVPIGRTLGNCLSFKNYRLLVAAFGQMRVNEMLFTGRLLTAPVALSCGFLTDTFEGDSLATVVMEVARQICTLAPLTIWAAKEARRRLLAAEPLIDYDDVVRRVYGSRDFAEGVQAYLEKRKPSWQGQ